MRAGFFPAAPKRFATLLAGTGEPSRVELMERRELGDDRVYRCEVAYPSGLQLRVRLGLAPDGKVSILQIQKVD